jgi:ATPase
VSEKYVLDTSIIIDGKISTLIKNGNLRDVDIIIPVAALDELQAQASQKKEPGYVGLAELKKLRELSEANGIRMKFVGERPSLEEIRLARSGRIDALIRDVAKREDAILYTGDYAQSLVAEAEGVRVRYDPPAAKVEGLTFEKYFTHDTLSLHLKENIPPHAKRGRPGKFEFVEIDPKPLTSEQIERMVKEITEATRVSKEGSIEISRSGATVVQLGSFRVAIARPPFSDGLEVTIVRPIVRLRLEDYKLSPKLMGRLKTRAEGVLVAGPPGSGKSTLASSLADYYASLGKVVKTFESPRDLQVGPEVTQYGPLEGDFEKSAEILLLVRPDYTIFDEVRRSRDFEIFADMRLAGVGMIGVVHASDPVNAIQRFMGRVELGMIPHIVDTVIFIHDGEIKKVLDLGLTVKVPTGMTEADLARPVVEVKDFENGNLVYEIYTFGEENVIIPVSQGRVRATAIEELAKERILQVVRKFDGKAEVSVVSPERVVVKVDNSAVPKLIGKGGVIINEIEDLLGIHIDVEPRVPSLSEEVGFEIKETGNSIDLILSDDKVGKEVDVYVDGEYLMSALVGKKSRVRISRNSDAGTKIINAILNHKEIKVLA